MMIEIKKTGNRFYRWDWRQVRSFPIAKAEAEKLIAAGEAVLVDGWYYEEKPEQAKPSNVVDFAAAKAEREEAKRTEEMMIRFKNEVLQNVSVETLDNFIAAAKSGDAKQWERAVMKSIAESAVNTATKKKYSQPGRKPAKGAMEMKHVFNKTEYVSICAIKGTEKEWAAQFDRMVSMGFTFIEDEKGARWINGKFGIE